MTRVKSVTFHDGDVFELLPRPIRISHKSSQNYEHKLELERGSALL